MRVDPERSLFRIGSASKTFTWTVIMQLVEEGRLSLDYPVNDHLPPALQVPDQGYDEPIRVRHLMTHSPGFEDTALGHLFVRDPGAVLSLEEYLARYRPARVRPPGVVTAYSNYGVSLAGAKVSAVAGVPFEAYVERRILEPLGMDHTTFREPLGEDAEARRLPAPMRKDLRATVLAVLGLVPVWRHGSWTGWRRLRYTLAVALGVAAVAPLHWWNMLGFQLP